MPAGPGLGRGRRCDDPARALVGPAGVGVAAGAIGWRGLGAVEKVTT